MTLYQAAQNVLKLFHIFPRQCHRGFFLCVCTVDVIISSFSLLSAILNSKGLKDTCLPRFNTFFFFFFKCVSIINSSLFKSFYFNVYYLRIVMCLSIFFKVVFSDWLKAGDLVMFDDGKFWVLQYAQVTVCSKINIWEFKMLYLTKRNSTKSTSSEVRNNCFAHMNTK